MPMNRDLYPSNWPKVSRTIRSVAGNRCEWCGIPNGAPLPSGARRPDGTPRRVVLTVAHLGAPYPDGTPGDKHDKHDLRRENLVALCQRCHLGYDMDDHVRNRRATLHRRKLERLRRAGQQKLFQESIA